MPHAQGRVRSLAKENLIYNINLFRFCKGASRQSCSLSVENTLFFAV